MQHIVFGKKIGLSESDHDIEGFIAFLKEEQSKGATKFVIEYEQDEIIFICVDNKLDR